MVSRQFLDRQFLDWVRNRVRVRVKVRVRIRVMVRVAVQELTVQELSCNPIKYILIFFRLSIPNPNPEP